MRCSRRRPVPLAGRWSPPCGGRSSVTNRWRTRCCHWGRWRRDVFRVEDFSHGDGLPSPHRECRRRHGARRAARDRHQQALSGAGGKRPQPWERQTATRTCGEARKTRPQGHTRRFGELPPDGRHAHSRCSRSPSAGRPVRISASRSTMAVIRSSTRLASTGSVIAQAVRPLKMVETAVASPPAAGFQSITQPCGACSWQSRSSS